MRFSQQTLKENTVLLLQKLIKIPSYSGQEKSMADFLLSELSQLGFEDVRQDEYGNVIGYRTGFKPGPTILFDAHMDVVPIGEHKNWDTAPFSGTLQEGKIWGRGATDTKGSMAAMIMALASLNPKDFFGTLCFVASVGEEIVEGIGLAKVLDAIRPNGVIVGEPTDCRLAFGQKGRMRILFTILGKAAHSSTPELGENALVKAAEVVRRIQQMPLPEDQWLGKGVLAPIQIHSTPFPSASTIPFECSLVCDRRLIHGETITSVLSEYSQALSDIPGCSVDVDMVNFVTFTGYTITQPDFHAGWLIDPNGQWVGCATNALKSAGIDPQLFTAPFCTDGSVSAGDHGLPTVIFGPSNIQLAHIDNEYIEVKQLLKGVKGYQALARIGTCIG